MTKQIYAGQECAQIPALIIYAKKSSIGVART